MARPQSDTPPASWAWKSLGAKRYSLLVACVVAQAATLAITWPAWQFRTAPPNLPLFVLPQFGFGWIVAASLAAMLLWPRAGLCLNLAILTVAMVADQWRMQPQVIGIALLTLAVVEQRATPLVRWYLIAMWTWAGLHKFLSPDWCGHSTWNLVEELRLNPHVWQKPFAYGAASAEVLLGACAVVRPRWAAVGCLLLHLGIAVLLSPWLLDWNRSVIPWNLCTAAVGYWLLRNTSRLLPAAAFERLIAVALLVSPAAFYFGWIDPSFAHALYSDNVPRALITSGDGVHEIARWNELEFPFPSTHRAFRDYFTQTAAAGSKLHIADPRPWVSDSYFVKDDAGRAVRISRDEFRSSTQRSLAGIELDDVRCVFALGQAGAQMLKRTNKSMIYAVRFTPDHYRPELLSWLRGLPNLEQLQLAGCNVTDNDLRRLVGCEQLTGIGLDDTYVSDAGITFLLELPKLSHLESDNTRITPAAKALVEKRAAQNLAPGK